MKRQKALRLALKRRVESCGRRLLKTLESAKAAQGTHAQRLDRCDALSERPLSLGSASATRRCDLNTTSRRRPLIP